MKKRRHSQTLLLETFIFIILVFNPLYLNATGTIDFEFLPDGTQSQDKMEIHDQFKHSHGVIFSLSNGENPKLAKVGSPQTAFEGFELGADQPAPGQNVGEFFLTDNTTLGLSGDLIITYLNPVKAASGVILDIDGGEKWNIFAFDSNDSEVKQITLTSGSTGTGEGIATKWNIELDDNVIKSIRITGSKPDGGFGLAFDNFSPSTSSFAPIANAGSDQIVKGEVILDGSKSYDLYGGEILSYHWELKYRENYAYSITAEGINPTITDLQFGFYEATLTVTDDDGLTSSDNMILAVTENQNTCEGNCLSQEQIDSILECMDLVKQVLSGNKSVGLKDAIRALETVAGMKK